MTTKTNEIREIREVSGLELVSVLKGIPRGTFSWINMETIQSFPTKTENPFWEQIKKVTKGNILIGGDYTKRVRTETGDSEFKSKKCSVGQHTEEGGNCVQYNENKDRFYLQYEWFEEVQPKPEFFFKGDQVQKDLFRSYLGVFVPNKYGVNIQSVMINNIKELHVNGVNYIVTELIPENPKPKVKKPSKKGYPRVNMGQMNQ